MEDPGAATFMESPNNIDASYLKRTYAKEIKGTQDANFNSIFFNSKKKKIVFFCQKRNNGNNSVSQSHPPEV